MKFARHQIRAAVVLTTLVVIIVAQPAYAYIDPSTGSLLWQIILASGLGALYLLKSYWHRIKRILAKETATEDNEQR